ncbi:MAG: hypothetical protein OFPII_44170 [Osedax symbiont Rs1]|nr:MAG: hypothetical protein OFPII_44170 [Osedax symbiont Rs1]
MSEEQNEIEIYQSNCFEKALNKLPENKLKIVEDEIDNIFENPEIGEAKRGDLSHLRVHKFKFGSQKVLLGYSWLENKVRIYLLYLGQHENFYKQAKKRRMADLKLIK